MAQDDYEQWETFGSESPRRYKESDSCHFNYQPKVHNSRPWWLSIKKEVAKVSGDPDRGYKWISRVDDITNPDDLQDSEGRNLLDSKVAAAFSKILHGALGKQIQLLEADKRLLKGRQIAWYIKDYFKLNAEHGEVLDFADLNAVKMQGTAISRFLHDRESVLLAINKIPDEVIMESLFFGQLEKTTL